MDQDENKWAGGGKNGGRNTTSKPTQPTHKTTTNPTTTTQKVKKKPTIRTPAPSPECKGDACVPGQSDADDESVASNDADGDGGTDSGQDVDNEVDTKSVSCNKLIKNCH